MKDIILLHASIHLILSDLPLLSLKIPLLQETICANFESGLPWQVVHWSKNIKIDHKSNKDVMDSGRCFKTSEVLGESCSLGNCSNHFISSKTSTTNEHCGCCWPGLTICNLPACNFAGTRNQSPETNHYRCISYSSTAFVTGWYLQL